jgi:hypothetical protein
MLTERTFRVREKYSSSSPADALRGLVGRHRNLGASHTNTTNNTTRKVNRKYSHERIIYLVLHTHPLPSPPVDDQSPRPSSSSCSPCFQAAPALISPGRTSSVESLDRRTHAQTGPLRMHAALVYFPLQSSQITTTPHASFLPGGPS